MFPVFRTTHVHGAHTRSQWPFYESMALCRSSQLWRSTEQLCSLWELHLHGKHCWRVWCCHGVHIFPWVSKCRKHQTLWNRRLVSVFATDWWYQYLTNVHFVNCSFMKLIIISQHPAVNRFHLGVKSTHQKRISVMNSDKSCWWSFVNSKCGNHFGIDFSSHLYNTTLLHCSTFNSNDGGSGGAVSAANIPLSFRGITTFRSNRGRSFVVRKYLSS